ncbi:hypothetical protein [Nocardioides sp. B-3]|uniref:hypothetical protein n=1 Tax=Nocardioides sp. B-3 TaxID=2895565 RepID=UPI0021523EE7|nr:hypothetical protein [Nocardioides sp. B-3]UUZ58673.1 hypothetical protein LP418_21530 [Nocardioides sp. B-3]
METREGMPGYDGHHGDGGGVFVEDCGGAGGNVCFSVNGAIDPVPGTTDTFSLFDLVLHETGHCLTLGHVGDGAEGARGKVPTTDIMAYSADPPGLNKCVSTLNVEVFATRMSHYLDVDADGAVTEADHLDPNDVPGDGSNSFRVQHPDDHQHASSTGAVEDCPQPDLGTVPGTPTDWTPEPVDTTDPVLSISTPAHGAETTDGHVHVAGTVERRPKDAAPTSPTASHDDPDSDSLTPLTDITNVRVEVTPPRRRDHDQGEPAVARRHGQPAEVRRQHRWPRDRVLRHRARHLGGRHPRPLQRDQPAERVVRVGHRGQHGDVPHPAQLPRAAAGRGAVRRLRADELSRADEAVDGRGRRPRPPTRGSSTSQPRRARRPRRAPRRPARRPRPATRPWAASRSPCCSSGPGATPSRSPTPRSVSPAERVTRSTRRSPRPARLSCCSRGPTAATSTWS